MADMGETQAGQAEPEPVGRPWRLWRQDDNGNTFLVSEHDDETAARAALAEFEGGVVHKQTYWTSQA